jgi:hypothetical protein
MKDPSGHAGCASPSTEAQGLSRRPGGTSARNRRLGAAVLLVAMAIHTALKIRAGILPELLWGCNVATFLIIAGLWVDSPLLVGPSFLWHACLGDVAFAVGAFARGQDIWPLLLAGWSSVVVHTLPTLAAFFYLRARGLPRLSPYLALLLFIVLVPISHFLTPPGLNINMAHVRWEPLRHAFPGLWSYRIVFSGAMLGLFLVGDGLTSRFLGRPSHVRNAGA